MKTTKNLFGCLLLLFLGAPVLLADDARVSEPTMTLQLDAPIVAWDEAIPLGNGLTGGLLWGEENELRLSLDRGDLWDLRVPPPYKETTWNYESLKALVKAGKEGSAGQRFDTPYRGYAYPTKLPGARLVITLAPTEQVERFGLDLRRAVGWVELASKETQGDGAGTSSPHTVDPSETQKRSRLGSGSASPKGRDVACFFSATSPVALVRIPGPAPKISLVANAAVAKLGYEPAEVRHEGDTCFVSQQAALGLQYVILVQSRKLDDGTLLAIALTTNRHGRDPLVQARQQCAKALVEGWNGLLKSHEQWWTRFWAKSSVQVPDRAIERQYNLVQYFYGAASHREAPPIPLQGVWTADSGNLPPWKGDYHNDLNTQLTYWAYLSSGHFDEGLSFLDFLWSLKPVHQKFARSFFGTHGLVVPGVMALDGKPMGGWPQYSFSSCNGAWVALAFFDHWRYTMDREFLKTRAYPYCLETAEGLAGLLQADPTGKLKLPLSSSPEIHNNSLKAWLTPNSNFDLALMRKLFAAVHQMADEVGDRRQAERWKQTLAKMDDLAVEHDTTRLRLAPDESLQQSHRHHSHLMSIHPLGIINVDRCDRDRAIIRASLDQLHAMGTRAWVGYSFSWAAAMSARAQQPERAVEYLQNYVHAFILRNGFHVNGDQTRSGLSGFTYRPFTLEGNFAAAQAVHEMLLQSWGIDLMNDPDPVIRIFPAMPWRWHDASFQDLRAEGGYLVSARRQNNATVWFRILATRDNQLRIRDNFDGRTPRFNRTDVMKRQNDFLVTLKAGEAVEAELPKPDLIPAAPANATKPFKLPGPIRPNRLPLRIGADSQGKSRFIGDIARASVFDRALSDDEVQMLAKSRDACPSQVRSCIACWDFSRRTDAGFASDGPHYLAAKPVGQVAVIDVDGPLGKAVHLDGSGYLTIGDNRALDCLDGVTLEAWIRPGKQGAGGARILDKTPVGGATAYMLDTYPGNSLRLVFRNPHVSFAAALKPGKWVHVVGTIDGKSGKAVLYIDGKKVKQQ